MTEATVSDLYIPSCCKMMALNVFELGTTIANAIFEFSASRLSDSALYGNQHSSFSIEVKATSHKKFLRMSIDGRRTKCSRKKDTKTGS